MVSKGAKQMKAKQKTIKVASGTLYPVKFKRMTAVPLWWVGKWVAVNSNHWSWMESEPQIELHDYVITHRKTGYAISGADGRWAETPLRKIRAIAEKLDALGAECWDFSKPNTVKTKRWQAKYKPIVFKILGKE